MTEVSISSWLLFNGNPTGVPLAIHFVSTCLHSELVQPLHLLRRWWTQRSKVCSDSRTCFPHLWSLGLCRGISGNASCDCWRHCATDTVYRHVCRHCCHSTGHQQWCCCSHTGHISPCHSSRRHISGLAHFPVLLLWCMTSHYLNQQWFCKLYTTKICKIIRTVLLRTDAVSITQLYIISILYIALC